jgi:5-(carboxyamino)imidazole ribonucleotide synthase
MMDVILPGGTIGVLGSGQLGRMLAIAARQMGYRVHVYSPGKDTPTGQVADREFVGGYGELDKVREFARSVDVVTYEFENVPLETAAACAEIVAVRPNPHTLRTAQNRILEKTTLSNAGLPVTPFRAVRSLQDLEQAVSELGRPAVLKTAQSGYDGKGQVKIYAGTDLAAAYAEIGEVEAVLEQFIEFEREVSVVGARGTDGSFVHYGVIENEHVNHILDVSIAPQPLPVSEQAIEITRNVFETLAVVGTLCVEFFVKDNKALINEIAPRPHNSGHLTIDGCVTNQFEQQLRAICGLPLGSPRYHGATVMVNLLGDLWENGEPNWVAALALEGVHLHLYGKGEARIGRKMGHLTVVANTIEDAKSIAQCARNALVNL